MEGARERQKATLQEVSSNVSNIGSVLLLVADMPLKKFIGHHTDTFRVLQTVHENIVSANISAISPLKMGSFVIVLHPNKTEILIGEGTLLQSHTIGEYLTFEFML